MNKKTIIIIVLSNIAALALLIGIGGFVRYRIHKRWMDKDHWELSDWKEHGWEHTRAEETSSITGTIQMNSNNMPVLTAENMEYTLLMPEITETIQGTVTVTGHVSTHPDEDNSHIIVVNELQAGNTRFVFSYMDGYGRRRHGLWHYKRRHRE